MSITPEYLYKLADDQSVQEALRAAASAIRQLRENRNLQQETIAAAVSAERERCALIADNATARLSPGPLHSLGFAGAKQFIADRIRAPVDVQQSTTEPK